MSVSHTHVWGWRIGIWAAAVLGLVGLGNSGQARDLTAGVVATEMAPEQQYPYLSGIVEGLAHARYVADERTPAGRSCIYEWFYDDQGTPQAILSAFARFPDYLPGAVIAAMIERRCGP